MLPDFAGRGLLLLCVALAPACVRLWRTRSLARYANDAALGERLIASHRGNTMVLSTCIALLIVVFTDALLWSLPLAVLSYMAAAYPLRRAIYGETWGFGTYLWFTGRLLFAVFGFWILLAATPILAHAAGSWDWITGGALASLLFAWNTWYGQTARAIMRARPVGNPALLERFGELAARFELPMPRFEQVDVRGGLIANAVALASRRGSAVVFTDPLLNLLDADECAAICAHELAHLEYYNPRRLRQLSAITGALIVTGVAIPVAARLAGWSDSFVPWIVWVGALTCGIAWMARHRQKNETASDLRAAAITGDPETLIRALTKLYVTGRMPRRLQPDLERQATHPSLARRIRDIRAAGGTRVTMLPPDATIVAPDTRTVVTFDDQRLHWHEGEAASHSLSYSHLSELRVHARSTGQASLVAVERGGRRWELPLAPGDIATVQAALDAVDGQLGEPVARSQWPSTARAIAALAAMFALGVGQVAAVLVAVFAIVQPSRRLRAAAGVAAIAAGCLALRSQGEGSYGILISSAILALTAGAALLILAVAHREDPQGSGRDVTPVLVTALGLLATASVLLLLVQARDVIRLHLWARSLGAATVLPLALAGALAFWRGRRVRYLSAPAAAVGVFTMLAGFPVFLDAFGRDPLLVSADAPVWKRLPDDPLTEFTLGFAATELRLSPMGRHVAVVRVSDSEDGPVEFELGPAGGTLAPVPASDLLFLNDEEVLLLQRVAGGVDLRQAKAASTGESLWQQHVSGFTTAELSVGRDGRTWHVVGTDSSGQLVHVEGTVGGDLAAQRRWTFVGRSGQMVAMAASGASAVLVEARYDRTGPPLGLWQLAMLVPASMMESRIWGVGANGDVPVGISRLDVRCVSEQHGVERLACIAFDGTRSRILSIDPATRRVAPIAQLHGRLFSYARLSNGWLTGWHGDGPVALRLGTREAVRVAARPYEDSITQLAPTNHVIGALSYGNEASTVRVYALE